MALMSHRLRGDGLYLMDEPEAALLPACQMTLLAMIHRYAGQGAHLIIAPHSPIPLAYPNAQILEFGDEGIQPVAYEQAEPFRVTRDFLNRYPEMLKVLLEDDKNVAYVGTIASRATPSCHRHRQANPRATPPGTSAPTG